MATRVVAILLHRLACPLPSLGLPGSQEHTGLEDRQAQIHIHIVAHTSISQLSTTQAVRSYPVADLVVWPDTGQCSTHNTSAHRDPIYSPQFFPGNLACPT